MKNLKLLTFLLAVIAIVGCGNSNKKEVKDDDNKAKDILDVAVLNMQKLDSSTVKIEANVKMPMMSMEMFQEGNIDFKKQMSKTRTTALDENSDEYYIIQDELVYTYSREEDAEQWFYYAELYDAESKSLLFNRNSFVFFANEYKTVKEVDSNEEGFTKLEIEMSNESFLIAMEVAENSDIEDVIAYVYIKDNYIHKLEVASDVKVKESGMTMTLSLELKIYYSNFNSISEINPPYSEFDDAIYYVEEDFFALTAYFASIIEETDHYFQKNSKKPIYCSGKEASKSCDIDATVKASSEKKAGGGAKFYLKYSGEPVCCDSITMSNDGNIHLKGCSVGDSTVKYNWSTEDTAYPVVDEKSIQSLKNRTVY